MKVLVTGKNGQVGYTLARKLSSISDVDVLPLDRKELDIGNYDSVRKIITEFRPDVVINAAAYTAVDKAEAEPDIAYNTNHLGSKNLALCTEEIGALLIHLSTDYVFSGDKKGLYNESDITDPVSVYGKTKRDGENAIIDVCSRYIIMRTSWVFCEYGNNFVKTMLRLAKSHQQLRIVADQYGGPTYAGDMADAIIHLMNTIIREKKEKYGIYHYSGLPQVNWSEFAEYIFEQAKKENIIEASPVVIKIPTSEYPTAAQRPKNSMMSTDRITADFGILASDWMRALNSLTDYKN
ncbi:MAG: dTDP-4-dehydrorhamnose reductase [Candidatus Erwinia impunctatus]|nr:dTDP-4-dehydrorhamnose reductase [Culicoides impunctatus]